MIRKFNEFNEWVEKSDPMISRGSVSIYEFQSYDSFRSFVMDNKDIFQNVKWAINPLSYHKDDGRSYAPQYFDVYLRKYPSFYVIIDYEQKNVFGISVSKYEFLCFDKDDISRNISDIQPYLDKLHLSLDDLRPI